MTVQDVRGMGLQMCSVFLSACARISVRSTKHLITNQELLLLQFGFTSFLALAILYGMGGLSCMGRLLRMPPAGWGCLLMLSIGIYGVGQQLQAHFILISLQSFVRFITP